MHRWIRSILNRNKDGEACTSLPTELKEPIIRLADVDAEYTYLKKVKCRLCGADTSAYRRGSDGPHDFVSDGGQVVSSVMHDYWTIFCNSCGRTRELTLAVPKLEKVMFTITEPTREENGRLRMTVDIDGREVKIQAIPTREEVRQHFVGQKVDTKSIRQPMIEDAYKRLNVDKNLLVAIQKPRILLALGDLNITEFFALYFALCVELAKKKNPGGETLRVEVEESVVQLLNEPNSQDALEKALDVLLRGDD